MSKKGLILGAIWGLPDSAFASFDQSLRNTGYDGELRLIRIEPEKMNFTPDIQRFFYYREELKKPEWNGTSFVMISDVRDVLFQRNPLEMRFTYLDSYMEDASYSIGSEYHNANWIERLYGSEELKRLWWHPINCSGVVTGSRNGILKYLDTMIKEAERINKHIKGMDQGIHNYIVWSQKLDIQCNLNEYSEVYTVGLKNWIRVQNHLILRDDGKIPAIVHQFDRHLRTP